MIIKNQENSMEYSEDKGYDYGMAVLQARSLRELVERVNDNGIMKEDIVDIIGGDEGFFLLYYK